jgi:MFS family permease
VGVSIYMRLRMQESPLFSKLKAEGKTSVNPIKESFGKKENLKLVLIALFGATAGQGVVWYTGQFYALSFIQKTCQIEFVQSNYIIAVALIIGTPLFVFFGWLSDRIGRKMIMMTGMLLAVLFYRPVYQQMYSLSDLSKKQEVSHSEMSSMQTIMGTRDTVITTITNRVFLDQTTVKETRKVVVSEMTKSTDTKKEITLPDNNYWAMIALILFQVVLVTMVYGPIAAFLVELFPTRIRYTSMSLPYHIGNGIFGGLTPFIATALAARGDIFAGLWYPIIVAAVCLVIGMIFLSYKRSAPSVE